MSEIIHNPNLSGEYGHTNSLVNTYEDLQKEFDLQTLVIQRFLEAQASSIADILLGQQSQIHFSLPDKVMISTGSLGNDSIEQIPTEQRNYSIGGVLDKWIGPDLRTNLRIKLTELEDSNNKAISTAARLLRFKVSFHLIHNILPSGRSVSYEMLDGEEIASEPVDVPLQNSAITQETDAIAEDEKPEENRGVLQSPFLPAAMRFFMPQWIAFETNGNMLVHTTAESESHITAMQKYLSILHMAVGLSPCMVADRDYLQKRNGILGQLVNQGRLLAKYQTNEIIEEINQRAKNNSLNRGLSLSLPYFDDQDLSIKLHRFEVIPSGRIMFVPAFVVRASLEEQAKIVQDTRLSPSTRKYLIQELKMLETAFLSVNK